MSPSGLCPYFGDCGGCQSQDLSYPAQVSAKEVLLRELFATVWREAIPVTPSPVVWHYRNKVDPAFAPKRYETPPPKDFERETVLGFKKRGRWYWPLEIEACRIGPEGLDKLMAGVRAWYRGAGLRAFDAKRKQGFLRNLLVRDGKRSGERMVVLLTCPGPFDAASFVKVVRETYGADSIYRGISESLADVAFAEDLELLYGAPTIGEHMRIPDGDGTVDLSFQISPMSFFQTNPAATELLYGAIRAWVHAVQPTHLYDLYGGMGGIAFSCADLVDQVWSVESVEAASMDGRENACRNGIENVAFITEKVEKYLRRLVETEGLAEGAAIVLDPARSGLVPKAIRRLKELAPENVLYVSCNPKILARELPELLETHELISMRGFDLFPHTRHVEVVASLRRRK